MNPSPRNPDSLKVLPTLQEAFTMTEAKLAHLNEAIAEVASRLGTKDERPGDVALARDLRQQLRNLVCACILAKSAT